MSQSEKTDPTETQCTLRAVSPILSRVWTMTEDCWGTTRVHLWWMWLKVLPTHHTRIECEEMSWPNCSQAISTPTSSLYKMTLPFLSTNSKWVTAAVSAWWSPQRICRSWKMLSSNKNSKQRANLFLTRFTSGIKMKPTPWLNSL